MPPKKGPTKRPTCGDDIAKAQASVGGSKRSKKAPSSTASASTTSTATATLATLPPAAAAATLAAVAAAAPTASAAAASLMSPTHAPVAAAAGAFDTTTPSKAKQPNFTASEEWVLCQAYLYHTQDSRVGTGQTAAVFKDKVYET
jgi:hypothetical protein